jgi:hypothetical protein
MTEKEPIIVHERVDYDVNRIHTIFERIERRCDILNSSDFECDHLISEGSGCRLSVAHFQYHGDVPNICQDCQSAKTGHKLAQNFDPLSPASGREPAAFPM